MTRRRFFAPPSAIRTDCGLVTLAGDESKHLNEVLRLRQGAIVYVFDGEGREFQCTVGQASRGSVTLTIEEEAEPSKPESPLSLTLGVALLKSDKMELVIQKATELGVSRLVPLKSKFTDIKLGDRAESDTRLKRWQRIALESAKQSGRAVVPTVAASGSFLNFLDAPPPEAARVVFSERGGKGLGEFASELPAACVRIFAATGPEGGWSDEELEAAWDAGWRIVTLGGRVMRAETAAVVVTALLQHRFGDLK